MRRGLLPAVLAVLVVAGPLLARQAPAERPTVALVLSGGGARGFAHLGVLEVLHDLHVPVDLVVGTSMGAVVGGLHATGLPHPDLVELFRSQDWDLIFRDAPDRRTIRLRHKRDDRRLTLPFELGIDDGGVRLPRAIITGAHLTNVLELNTWPAHDITDFDALPIRFRAVATDVSTGEAVVLGAGRLATAIRASMAVPGIFPPVESDGRQLVDGGVVENLPLRVARELGADVAIVVDIATGLDDAPEGESLLSLSQRVLTIFMTQNTRAQLRDLRAADILIVPDLAGHSTADFSKLESALDAGAAATRRVADRLRALAVPAERYREIVERRAAAWPSPGGFTPAFIDIDTTHTRLSPDVIRGVTRLRADVPVDIHALAAESRSILGYGGFERVEVGIRTDPDGARGVVLQPHDKAWGPGVLRGGLQLFDRQRGDAGWDLTLGYTHTRLNAAGAQLRAYLQLGSVQGSVLELYHPLDARERWFATAELAAVRRDALLASDTSGPNTSVEFADLALSAALGIRIGTSGELRAGFTRGILRVERPALPDGGTVERIDAAGFVAELEIDRLDAVAFPRTGELVFAGALIGRHLLGGEQSFERVSFDGSAFRSRGRHTLGLGVFAGSALGSELPTTQRFSLGGLFRLTGVQPSGIQGRYAGFARVMYRNRITEGTASIHLGSTMEAGGAWDDASAIDTRDVRLSASAFLGIDTPLGPVHLAYGFTRGVDPGWLLRLGTVF